MNGNIQLCPFDAEGRGIDDAPSALVWYDSPAAGKQAALELIEKYPAITSVWVRKITDGHMRTVTTISRPEAPTPAPAVPAWQPDLIKEAR